MEIVKHPLLKWLRASIHEGLRLLGIYSAGMASIVIPQGSHVLEKRTGEGRLEGAKRLAIFTHFDRRGEVHEYVVYYLAALRKAGFEIVFVSNSRRLKEDAWRRVLPYCALVLRRRNLGHDFGAFRDALGLIGDVSRLDELLLVNDSVYGPLCDLAPLLERCDPKIASVWSMTDCWDNRYHLQSYFVLFKREALCNPAFQHFWTRVRLVQSKSWAIRKYEVGLTQAMMKAGLRCAALFPYRRLTAALMQGVMQHGLLDREDLSDYHRGYARNLFRWIELGTPLNPTHFFWDHLIAKEGAPFIKRDLLLHNPMRVPYVSQWEAVIRQSSDYDPDLILRHLECCSRRRAV